MLRKISFAALAGLGLLGAAPAADAASISLTFGTGRPGPAPVVYGPTPAPVVAYRPGPGPVGHRHHHADYRVMYRPCDRDPWVSFGSFHSRREATMAAHRLENRGYEVFVR